MKKAYLIFTAAVIFSACGEGDKKTEETKNPAPADSASVQKSVIDYSDTSNLTTIEWIDKENQVLPKIKAGESVEITYRFRNTGTKPLIIKDVAAGCGCTVPEKPKEPIMPGQTGVIKAAFNSAGRSGTQQKSLTVYSNAKSGDIVLSFSVDVEGK